MNTRSLRRTPLPSSAIKSSSSKVSITRAKLSLSLSLSLAGYNPLISPTFYSLFILRVIQRRQTKLRCSTISLFSLAQFDFDSFINVGQKKPRIHYLGCRRRMHLSVTKTAQLNEMNDCNMCSTATDHVSSVLALCSSLLYV